MGNNKETSCFSGACQPKSSRNDDESDCNDDTDESK